LEALEEISNLAALEINKLKYELQTIICGTGKVSYGDTIQAATRYLRRSKSSSGMAEEKKSVKNKETESLRQWIEKQQLWFNNIDMNLFLSQGAEQKVYLNSEKEVLKLNDAIYYTSWIDYFNNLLLNNYFFPDTAYELKGFYKDNGTLYAVVRQEYIKADTPTSLEEVKTFMKLNGFINIRNNDYRNPELGIILEDLHDENVLTRNGSLFFIDTVFYIEPSFWQIEKIDKIL
jgi:hypothetical protein